MTTMTMMNCAKAKETTAVQKFPVRWAAPLILDYVCTTCKVTHVDLFGKGRDKRAVRGREMYCGIARAVSTGSWPEIGRSMARRNHATALTAAARFAKWPLVERRMHVGNVVAVLEHRWRTERGPLCSIPRVPLDRYLVAFMRDNWVMLNRYSPADIAEAHRVVREQTMRHRTDLRRKYAAA